MKKKPKRLTSEQVGFLRDDYLRGIDKGELAENYDVTRRTVERIVNNESRYSAEYGAAIGRVEQPTEKCRVVKQKVKDDEPKPEPEPTPEETPWPMPPKAPVIMEKAGNIIEDEEPVEEKVEPVEEKIDPRDHLQPGEIILKLSPMSISLIQAAMRKTGIPSMETFCYKTLIHATKQFIQTPLKCPFSLIKRKTIKG